MVAYRQSTETRPHRPYQVDQLLERLFELTYLSVAGTTCEPNRSVEVESTAYQTHPIKICWAENDTAFDEFKSQIAEGLVRTGLDPVHATLIVHSHSTYIKSARCLQAYPAGDLTELERVTTISTPAASDNTFQAPRSGCEITVALVVNKCLDVDRPSRPRDKAYWLARATFTVSDPKRWPLWQPQILDEDARERFRLSEGVVAFVQMGDDSDVMAPLGDSVPSLWIAEDVWTELEVRPKEPSANACAWQLAAILIRETVFRYSLATRHQSSQPTRDEGDYLKDSLIGAIVTAIAGKGATDEERRKFLAEARSQPGRIAALAEGTFELKQAILASLLAH